MYRAQLPEVHGLQTSYIPVKDIPTPDGSVPDDHTNINANESKAIGLDNYALSLGPVNKMCRRVKFWKLLLLAGIVCMVFWVVRQQELNLFSDDNGAFLPNVKVLEATGIKEKSKTVPKGSFMGSILKLKGGGEEDTLQEPVGLGVGETLPSLACVPLKAAYSALEEVKICIYHPEDDAVISKSLLYNGTWDEDTLTDFKAALASDPEMGVIDIGANLGTYSLLAGSLNRPVLAVEASHFTALRLKKSVEINNFRDRISIVEAAIMSKRGYARMEIPIGNAGAAFPQMIDRSSITEEDHRKHLIAKAIRLEDIVPYIKFQRVVLKMDIDGEEYSLLEQAPRLFDVRDIRYIFVAFSPDKGEQLGKGRGARFLLDRGFIPKKSVKDSKMFIGIDNESWPSHLVWVKVR